MFFIYLTFIIDGNIRVHTINKEHSHLDFKYLLKKSEELHYSLNLIESDGIICIAKKLLKELLMFNLMDKIYTNLLW
jgi:hypothetical protein